MNSIFIKIIKKSGNILLITPPQLYVLFTAICSIGWLGCAPQKQMQPPSILQNGLEIIRKTITANGGTTWQQPQTLMLSGTALFTPHGEVTEARFFDRYAMFRVFPSDNIAAHQANGKVRFDAFEGNTSFFELKFDGKKSHSVLSDPAKVYEKYFRWSNNFGFGILRFADRDSFKVTRLTDDSIEGYPCHVVRITDPKKQITTFWIDKKRYYIRQVGFNTDVGFHHRVYSQFAKARNVAFVQPQRVQLYFEGVKWMDIHWANFEVNKPIADAIFE